MDRRHFLFDLPVLLALEEMFSRASGQKDSLPDVVPATNDMLDYWVNQMGVPREMLLGGDKAPPPNAPKSDDAYGLEPQLFYYDAANKRLVAAQEAMDADSKIMPPTGDVQVDFQVARMRLNAVDQKQFSKYSTGAIFLDFQQHDQAVAATGSQKLGSTLFSTLFPDKPSDMGSLFSSKKSSSKSQKKTDNTSTSKSVPKRAKPHPVGEKPDALAQTSTTTQNPNAKAQTSTGGTTSSSSSNSSSGGSSGSTAASASQPKPAGTPAPPAAPGSPVAVSSAGTKQTLALPGGMGKAAFNAFAKDSKKSAFGTVFDAITRFTNSPILKALPILSFSGVATSVISDIRGMVGNLMVEPNGGQHWIMRRGPVDVAATLAALEKLPQATRLRSGYYIAVPNAHLQYFDGHTENVDIVDDGFIVPAGTPVTKKVGAVNEMAAGASYLTLKTSTTPMKSKSCT